MKESKTVYVTKHSSKEDQLDRNYPFYATKVYRDYKFESGTKETGVQYNYKKDNVICTCRNTSQLNRHHEVRHFNGFPKQLYAYHDSRSYTDIGIGRVKAYQRKKVKRIYLPETDNRGVGSSDLSPFITRKTKFYKSSHYDHKKTSSKCVGGVIEINSKLLNENLSPVLHTKSVTTGQSVLFLDEGKKYTEHDSKSIDTASVQVDNSNISKPDIKQTREIEFIVEHTKNFSKHNIKEKKYKEVEGTSTERRKRISKRAQEAERVFSSDSLVQHVHNLENSCEEAKIPMVIDPIENKLEREYRRMFSTKSKDQKSSEVKSVIKKKSVIKSTSVLRRRFEALRRGLAKKDDPKKNTVLTNESDTIITPSYRDVSITSDPPSLECRSYSNTNIYTSLDRMKYENSNSKIIYKKSYIARRDFVNSEDEDSESQGVKGMFKLWGKKFKLDDESLLPGPSVNVPKECKDSKTGVTNTNNKKEIKKFFFFKKKSRDNTKKQQPYKQKKGVTAGRCEVGDGLMIKIGAASTCPPAEKYEANKRQSKSRIVVDKSQKEYESILRNTWLQQFLAQSIESKNSVKIRWNNIAYATSSSTVFEIMENVYKYTGAIFRSKSEVTSGESSYYKSCTKQRVNFFQDVEAWMMPKFIPDIFRPKLITKRCNERGSKKDNIQVSTSNNKWYIDKSKAFAQKIEVVLHSKNLVKSRKDTSSEYLRIDIPKGFFSNTSRESVAPIQTSNEEVYKIVEYEAPDSNFMCGNNQINIGDTVANDIKVTVSIKGSCDFQSKILETVIKQPPVLREVVIQGSNVYVPKTCNVIGVGIITQKDMTKVKKPILKIQDEYSEDSEQTIHHNKKQSKFAESYLRDYYHQCSPLGIDFFSWCVSDSHIQCSSDISNTSVNQQGDGSKSCPNIYDDYQASTLISSCGTSCCSQCASYEDEPKHEDVVTRFFNRFKSKIKSDSVERRGVKRILPKDSLEVSKRRKLYANSNKSKWFCNDDKLYSVASIESRSAQDNLGDGSRMKRPCSKQMPKKNVCRKHVSIPDCDSELPPDPHILQCPPPGILTFKGSSKCDACNRSAGVKCPKHMNVIPEPTCHIPPPNMPCQQPKLECKLSPRHVPLCPSLQPSTPPSRKLSPMQLATHGSPLNVTGILPGPLPGAPPLPILAPSTSAPISPKSCTPPPKSVPPCQKKTPPCTPKLSKRKPPPCTETVPSRTCVEKKTSPGKAPCTPGSCPPGKKNGQSTSPPRPPSTPCPHLKMKSSYDTPPVCLSPLRKEKPCKSPPTYPTSSPTCLGSSPSFPGSPSRPFSPPTCPSSPPICPTSPRPCSPKKKPSNSPPCKRRSPKRSPCQSPRLKKKLFCNSPKPCSKPMKSPCVSPPTSSPPCTTALNRNPCPRSPPYPSSQPVCPPTPPSCPPSPPPCQPHRSREKLIRPGSVTPPCPSNHFSPLPSLVHPPPSKPIKCDTPPCKPFPNRPPCDACKKSPSQEFPWPMQNQVSTQPSVSSHCPPPCESPSPKGSKCRKNCSFLPPESPKPIPRPRPCKTPPKRSGIFLKKDPFRKTCSKECTSWQNDRQCTDRAVSEDNIVINIKQATESTEEIREGMHIKVQDEDGNTLYERRDFKKNRPSVINDMYSTNKHAVSTIQNMEIEEKKSEIEQNEVQDITSEVSVANLIEINFKLKVTQGDKATEINIGNNKEKPEHDRRNQIGQTSHEVFHVDEAEQCIGTEEEVSDKNDINIKIIVKNYKPKKKNDRKKYSVDAENFTQKISDKFHTVSTGYSDIVKQLETDNNGNAQNTEKCDYKENLQNAENVYSVHRATIDLNTSTEISQTLMTGNNEAIIPDKYVHKEEKNVICSRSVTEKSDTKQSGSKLEDRTDKIDSDFINIQSYYKGSYICSKTGNDYSMTDVDDQGLTTDINTISNAPSNNVKSTDFIPNSLSKEEKKQLLKMVFEKAYKRRKTRNKGKTKQFRDMLKLILTSDSSDHDDIAVTSNELVKEMTYASLQPNLFRDTDSMNNYYKSPIMSSVREMTDSVKYPTKNTSQCLESSDAAFLEGNENSKEECLCSTIAARLNMCRSNEARACCCRKRTPEKTDVETFCDVRTEEDFFLLNYVDVETQNSKFICNSNNISVHSRAIVGSIDNSVEADTKDILEKKEEVEKVKRNKRTFSPHASHLKPCEMKRLNRNTMLGISDEDKVYYLNTKSSYLPLEQKKTRDTKRDSQENSRKKIGGMFKRPADLLQCYETKKAVLKIYAENTYSDEEERIIAKLPKFTYDKESAIERNYGEFKKKSIRCLKQNVVMMSVNR